MSKKKSYGQDTKEFQQAEIEEEQFRREKMSKKDEIIKLLEEHEGERGYGIDFEPVATEIERLFAKSNAEWFKKGQNSIKRKNKSGCCCILDDSDNILSACGAHQDWHDELIKPTKS